MARTERNSLKDLQPQNVAQSYIVTSALYDFTVYEKRIVYNLIRCAQKEIREAISSNTVTESTENVIIRLPISSCLISEEDKNYRRIKQAMVSLSTKSVTYGSESEWHCYSLLPAAHIDKKTCMMTLEIRKEIWNALKNIDNGYSEYDYNVAFTLQSPYSMRLYEMLCSQKWPMIFSIEHLRNMFMLQDKYSSTKDFIRKVIEHAKNELDEKSPVGFTYTKVYTGKKVTSIKFTPVRRNSELPFTLPEDVDPYDIEGNYTEEELDALHAIGFSESGIRNNSYLLLVYKLKCGDFAEDLRELEPRAAKKENPCGWTIRTLECRLEDLEKKHRI